MSDTPPVVLPICIIAHSRMRITTTEGDEFESRGLTLDVPTATEPPDPEEPPPDPGESQARACIELDGAAHIFDPAEGEELDSYYDPDGDFVQRCIRCTSPDLPDFVAWYRPDRDSSREEWVFELGSAFQTAQANLPAYSVTITCANGDTVDLVADRGHYWFARWRWQSAPRPVRRTYETLASQNLIPHFDCTGLATGSILSVSDYTPMALCGLPASQSQTGAYPGLGIVTGWQAQYLARNAPEDAWRAQAEATNSYNSFVRDPDTLAPLDIVNDYPDANMYSSSTGTPFINKGPCPNRTDTGHLPSTVYIPFLLTGDPYHLEAMQFTCNYQMLSQPGNGSRIMVCGRYLAWPTRAIAECVAATPDSAPSWLLPKSYFEHWLDTCRGFVEDRMANNSNPWHYVFHSIPDGGQSSDLDPPNTGDHVWQQNFLDLVASWLACWRDEWLEPAEWCVHSVVDRASATSGWCRARCSPYHMRYQNASVLAEAFGKQDCHFVLQYPQHFRPGMSVKIDSEVLVLQGSADGLTWTFEPRTAPADHAAKKPVYGDKCTSWQEAADLSILTYDWAEDVADNDHLAPSAEDLTYQGYQRAALAQALHAGLEVPGLRDAFAWLDGEMRANIATGDLPPISDNWAVVPAETRRRRRRRRTDRTDVSMHPALQALLDEIRGAD